jgi:integrase
MSQPVFEALQEQYKATGAVSEYVFCNLVGAPLDNKNFTERVWYPLLRHMNLEPRKPYQMRHTAATSVAGFGGGPGVDRAPTRTHLHRDAVQGLQPLCTEL